MVERERMSSRERVLAAIAGKPVDKLPVMYWLNPHMGCRLIAEHRAAADGRANLIGRALWRRFVRKGELDAGEWTRALPNVLIGYCNGPYLAQLGADVAMASIGSVKRLGKMLGMIRRQNGRLRVHDPLGCVRGVGGIYLDVVEPPIKGWRELRDFPLPPLDDVTYVLELRRTWPEVCIAVEVSGVQQVLSDILWDMECFMLGLYDCPEEIAAFQLRLADWAIAQARNAVRAGAGNDLGAAVDAWGDRLCFATGIDTQRGEAMSPAGLAADIRRAAGEGTARGRFILSMTHVMQYTMPSANVAAILETVGSLRFEPVSTAEGRSRVAAAAAASL